METARGGPQTEEPPGSGHRLHPPEDLDPVLVWVPIGRRLISGLLGLNVVLLGAALLAAQAFNPEGLRHQEPQVFILLLLAGSVLWMLWFLLWSRRRAGMAPHQDHHAGGVAVTRKRPTLSSDCLFFWSLLKASLLCCLASGSAAVCCVQRAAVRLPHRLPVQREGVSASRQSHLAVHPGSLSHRAGKG